MKAIIVGAGVGGLTSALFLNKYGIECEIYEQVPELRELGVGITLQTNAVRELGNLDLLPSLHTTGVSSQHLYYLTRRGQPVWDEPRGLAAGHDTPQFFVHRGRLQSLLYRAVMERLRDGSVHLGHRLASFARTPDGVEAHFVDRDGSPIAAATADLLIGADGIHSTVRRRINPNEGGPRWGGLILWRGAVEWPEFLGGASVLIAGGSKCKFVAYPIAPGATAKTFLTNWVVQASVGTPGSEPPHREDWSQPARREDLEPFLGKFTVPQIDVRRLIAKTGIFWEYPMCDRDPIEKWSVDRAILLGDAAHPMYPMGGNGGSQAILDAACLARELSSQSNLDDSFAAYVQERLPPTNAIAAANRTGGPENVIDVVEERAPDGFDDIERVMPRAERETIMGNYAKQAGYALVRPGGS